MSLRSRFRSPQVVVAGIGAFLVAGAVSGLLATGWERTAEGAIVVDFNFLLYVAILWVGFPVLALGLSIQRERGDGIEFERPQRWLLIGAGIAWGVNPLVAGTLSAVPRERITIFVATAVVAVVAFLAAVGWRGVQRVRSDRPVS
jgi:hypothetical protein